MATEPQSIVHQVIRLERKIARAFLRRRSRFGRKELGKVEEIPSSSVIVVENVLEKSPIQDDNPHATVSAAIASMKSRLDFTLVVHEYRTINQIEFMVECLIANTNECFLVHFYVEDSFVSENIDKKIKQLAASPSRFHWLRINSRLAPLITAKLKIQKELPTVVTMKDGSVVRRISEFSSPDCWELGTWASI
jgi:hypothetical protein